MSPGPMAPLGGKPGGATPSLSSLQAALRRGPAGTPAPKAPAAGLEQEQAATEPAAAVAPKRSLSAEEDVAATLPPKKRAVPPQGVQGGQHGVAKVPIVKTPTAGTPRAKASGLCAKIPSPGPPLTGLPGSAPGAVGEVSPGAAVKAGSLPAQRPPPPPAAPPRPAAVAAPAAAATAPGASQLPAKASVAAAAAQEARGSGGAAGAGAGDRGVLAITELMAALEAATGGTKLRHTVKLAEAMGRSLPIDHINHFLRVLKKKILERAQQDGVRVQMVKAGTRQPAPQAPAQPAAALAAAAMPAAAPAPGTVVAGAAAAVDSVPPQPAPEIHQGAVPKQPRTMAKQAAVVAKQSAAVTKQPGAVAKQPGSLAKSPGAVAKQPGAVPKTAATLGKQPGTIAKQRPQAKWHSRPSVPGGEAAPPPAPPPPQPAPQQASPLDSPGDGAGLPPVSPGGTDLTQDPLYILVGELTEDPVCRDGEIREARLAEVLRRLWDGVARKPKDWVAAWQAMTIPLDKQSEALQRLLNMAFCQTEDPDRAPLVVAELVKSHKVKMRAMEEVLIAFGGNLDGINAVNENAWHIYAQFLVHVFPKPAGSGWGWSRVGWSWQSWWQFVEKCTQTLENSVAFDVLGLILKLVQDKEGQPLTSVQVWTDGDKLDRVLAKLAELGACSKGEVVSMLSLNGLVVDL